MPAPRIALAPAPVPDWAVESVRAGGGQLVEPEEAEGLVWMHPFAVQELRALLAGAPGVRWVQLPWAGVEVFAEAGIFDDGRTWTCGKGVYAEHVAEHALALSLYGLRDLHERTRASAWARPSGRSLVEGRVTILGGGGITEALLGLLQPFRATATVVRRKPEPVAGGARVLGPDRLLEGLRGADVVVLALALTPETRGIIGRRELEHMEPHAWLVNVARGAHVVTDDLVRALQDGVIAGAALDVTDPEPLPEGHPLWQLPNCLVTPHVANTPEMAVRPLSARIRENVHRFGSGARLIGLVDAAAGY